MGYPELLRVLGEEAAREAGALRAGAERERDAIVARALAGAGVARDALAARTGAEAEALRRTRLEAMARDRDRVLLLERRRLLEGLRGEVLRRLAAAGSPAVDAALLAEVLGEAGDGPLEVVVDPGAEEAARASIRAIAPAAADRAVVRAAPERRGGVLVVAGRRVLDDTLPSRLARAWPDLEAELAALLGEG